jgi:cytochrome c-type biogenesis protein CcmH/NrfG
MLRKVLILDPDHFSAHYLLGANQLLRGNPEAALAEFEQESEKFRAEGRIRNMRSPGYCKLGPG